MIQSIVAWNGVRSGMGDGFGYVIRRLAENPVREVVIRTSSLLIQNFTYCRCSYNDLIMRVLFLLPLATSTWGIISRLILNSLYLSLSFYSLKILPIHGNRKKSFHFHETLASESQQMQ